MKKPKPRSLDDNPRNITPSQSKLLQLRKTRKLLIRDSTITAEYIAFKIKGFQMWERKLLCMLRQFGNATTVALTLDTLEVIKSDGGFIEQSPSPFPNMKRLKLIKGRWDISTVLQCVMNYLTAETLHCDSLTAEVPHGVDVVEHNLSDGFDGGADLLQLLQHQCTYSCKHRSLRLHARCRPDLTLPQALFTSETLRELELRQFRYVIWTPNQFSCLQHLKTLTLVSTALVSIGRGCYFCLKEPFSGLSELEKLTIGRSLVYGLIVKAPKLRVLEIIDQEYSYSHMMVEIYAPLLTSMLQQLGNAKIVALSLDTLKVLEMDGGLIEQSPCPFPYMKCLKIIKRRRKISTVLRRVMNFLNRWWWSCHKV
ncbi:hypothetical protein SASPL_104215 [Salvia splendens]|uniref:FBD domain-containing protein n=1 Tax=Salvia splendens TaxID=180675 RepID=A0A8X8YIV6_SALSN|nr:hypothetical protein SASPL_104215 [Salvia splendens]